MCRATAQCRSTISASPCRPSAFSTAQTAKPRARRDISGENASGARFSPARQVARGDAHRPLQRRRVAHDRQPAVVGHLQPLVRVRRPAVGRRRARRSAPPAPAPPAPRARRRRRHAPRRPSPAPAGSARRRGRTPRCSTFPACRQTTTGPSSPASTAASASGRIRPCASAAATCTRSAPKPSSRRLRIDRGMRLAADHHMHLRRAEQPPRLHVPAGPAQQRAARRRERGEVRHRRPGAEADARPRPAARAGRAPSPAATSSTAAAAGVGSAKAPVCPQAEVSQSAATPAGCEAPITQPWKFGLVIPRSPPSARRHQLLHHRVRRQPASPAPARRRRPALGIARARR